MNTWSIKSDMNGHIDIDILQNANNQIQAGNEISDMQVLHELGGINKILSVFISLTKTNHGKFSLRPDQIDKLYDIIASSSNIDNYNIHNNHTLSSTSPVSPVSVLSVQPAPSTGKEIDPDQMDFRDQRLVYSFETWNAGLYWVCKSQKKRDKVFRFINNKVYHWWTILFMISMVVIFAGVWQYSDSVFDLQTIDGQEGSDTFFGFCVFILLLANLWIFFLILSLNRRAFLMLLRMFLVVNLFMIIYTLTTNNFTNT